MLVILTKINLNLHIFILGSIIGNILHTSEIVHIVLWWRIWKANLP